MTLTPRKAGYGVITGPGGTREFDTQTCGHCGRVYCVRTSSPDVEVDIGGHCRICDHAVCGSCCDRAQLHGCEPLMRRIEAMEARGRFLRSVESA